MKNIGMPKYNFLSVGGAKYGVQSFTIGGGGKIVSVEEALQNFTLPLCWAGNYKLALYEHCIKHNITFYNLDTGYFGNTKRKEYKRVTLNAFQDVGPIIKRPSDRLDSLNLNKELFTRGNNIVIVPPDSKKCHSFGIKSDEWINEVTTKIKKYTDRPVVIRERPVSRLDRTNTNTFSDFIRHNTYCVVGHSSNALVESILHGIPVVSLGPSATNVICSYTIDKINDIPNIDLDFRHDWLCHLSYRQFTEEELYNGLAYKLLQ